MMSFQWFYWWICISLRGLRLFSHVTWLGTGQFRWSIGTNGTIGTNRKWCHSSGSTGECASHCGDLDYFLCDITGYRAFLTVHCSEESQQLVMDLHLRGFKRILLLTAKAWISSTTTFNKDGELRGTTSKPVRSSTNLMRAPQLWTRSLTITANNTGLNFVPWGRPPFRYKGAET